MSQEQENDPGLKLTLRAISVITAIAVIVAIVIGINMEDPVESESVWEGECFVTELQIDYENDETQLLLDCDGVGASTTDPFTAVIYQDGAKILVCELFSTDEIYNPALCGLPPIRD